jgi:hypothetical protein
MEVIPDRPDLGNGLTITQDNHCLAGLDTLEVHGRIVLNVADGDGNHDDIVGIYSSGRSGTSPGACCELNGLEPELCS